MNQTKLRQLNEEMEKYFQELYAPEGRILVPGDGDASARVALVGEAPGEQEALLRRPFVGRAGKNLDEFLSLTGLKRPQLYITNAVKFRPVRQTQRGQANRPPTREEIELFRPWLLKELGLVRPRLVASLGNVPLLALTGRRAAIGQLHGQMLELPELGCALFPLYHPAAVIYNPSLREAYLRDMQRFGQLYARL